MYIPRHFQEERIPVLHGLIREQGFAMLVTLCADGLVASHIPMILDTEPEPLGTLRGHVSRANPQWRTLVPGVRALAIFSGPQHYVSPSWYPEKQESGKVVPTWNYAVVHAYGHTRVIEDADWLRAHVTSLTAKHEADFPEPWKVTDAPGDYIASMVKGIVGIEVPIESLEGRWKVNQNRSAADRVGVVSALESLGDPDSVEMARMVAATLTERDG